MKYSWRVSTCYFFRKTPCSPFIIPCSEISIGGDALMLLGVEIWHDCLRTLYICINPKFVLAQVKLPNTQKKKKIGLLWFYARNFMRKDLIIFIIFVEKTPNKSIFFCEKSHIYTFYYNIHLCQISAKD